MKKILQFITYTDHYLLLSSFITIISILVITLSYFMLQNGLPSKIPLFYSLPWGQPQLVEKGQFLVLPAILLLFGLVNTLLASYLHKLQTVLIRSLLLSIIFLDLIIVITAAKILLIFI